MNNQFVAQILVLAIGILSVLGAYFQWGCLFNSRKTRLFSDIIGRTGTRLFFTIVGLGLFTFGFMNMISEAHPHLLLSGLHIQ